MQRLLLIDVGNTRTKWAEVSGRGAIQPRGSIASGDVSASWAASFAKKFPDRKIVIASVVPVLTRRLGCAFPRALFVTGTLAHLPLTFAYPRPAEIGADRIAAAIGARASGAAIIVSCGTATALSVLDARGRFCGGAILPGLAAQLAALLGATAQLPALRLPTTPRALGRSTRAAIGAGLVLGYRAAVRDLIVRLRGELASPPRIIVTGGEANHLRGLRELGPMEFKPLLVFEGLRIIAASLPAHD